MEGVMEGKGWGKVESDGGSDVELEIFRSLLFFFFLTIMVKFSFLSL